MKSIIMVVAVIVAAKAIVINFQKAWHTTMNYEMQMQAQEYQLAIETEVAGRSNTLAD